MGIKVIAESIMIGEKDAGRVVGQYNLKRVRQGEKFELNKIEDFSSQWMKLNDDKYETFTEEVSRDIVKCKCGRTFKEGSNQILKQTVTLIRRKNDKVEGLVKKALVTAT